MSTATGELRYRLRCLDKLGFTFRGDEAVLDAGCGDGGVARLLRQRVRDVVGVDVERSVQWHDEPGLAFRVADAERLGFEDATFDVIYSKDSLHQMDSPERALAEYRRVLKPGGPALIVEANRFNPIFYPHMTLALGHEHFTRRRFHALVTAVSRAHDSALSRRTTCRASNALSRCSTHSRKLWSGCPPVPATPVVQLRGRVRVATGIESRASSSRVRNLQNWLCDRRRGTTANGSTHATASTLARLGVLADG
jgi:SAM-dependent methyltransferase